MQNRLLVVIVAYNSMQWAKRCYDSLRASAVPVDVITIDNGSTDGTPDYIRNNYPEVELIEKGENLGFGRANNIGLQKALNEGYDYVYLLNQDAWVEPDTFAKLIDASLSHPEYGVLSPMQMKADLSHLDDRFVTYAIGEQQNARPYLLEDLYFDRLAEVYDTNFVMAAHWFITRRCLETVGGFSPTFYHYGEDNNYLMRTRYWKFKIGIVTSAIAVHDRGDSNWSQDKMLYVTRYTQALVKASNPLCKWSVWSYIRENTVKAIKGRKKLLWDYAVRLFNERKQIDRNYRLSLKPCAFLERQKQ